MVIFFFNDTAATEIYTLSLHDALPICQAILEPDLILVVSRFWQTLLRDEYGVESEVVHNGVDRRRFRPISPESRGSEEHTSELQSRQYLVCRLLLEKKKNSLAT